MARKFWKWFTKNQQAYLQLNKVEDVESKDELQNDLLSKLNDYRKGLFYEIGGQPDGKAALIITAEGNLELFEDVRRLIKKAPKLEKWEFIAFKQPMGSDFKVNYEGLEVDPKSLWFLPLKNIDHPESIGLRIGIPDYNDSNENRYIAAAYLILDTILGEENNAQYLGYVEVNSLPENFADNGYIELNKLLEFVEWKKDVVKLT